MLKIQSLYLKTHGITKQFKASMLDYLNLPVQIVAVMMAISNQILEPLKAVITHWFSNP